MRCLTLAILDVSCSDHSMLKDYRLMRWSCSARLAKMCCFGLCKFVQFGLSGGLYPHCRSLGMCRRLLSEMQKHIC